MRLILLALLAVCAGAALAQEARIERYAGVASDARAADPLYAEEHWLRLEQGELVERQVLYRCPSGGACARKRVDYRADPLAPAFALEDARFGYREGLHRDADGAETFVRRSVESPAVRSPVREAPRLVADSGFDRFVLRHWEALGRGEAVPLEFLVPSRGDSFAFRVRLLERRTVGGVEARVLRLSLGGPLGWFAPAIDVAYAESDRPLLRFEGLSNIRHTPERNAVVRIDFPQAPERVDPGAWDAVARTPLQPCSLGS